MKGRHITTDMEEVYEVSAKTVAEAYAKANELYGGENKEIKCEIVSEPKKGLFGIGSKDAVIKVTVTENVGLDLGKIFGDGLLTESKEDDKEREGRRNDSEKKEHRKDRRHDKRDRRQNQDRGQREREEKAAAPEEQVRHSDSVTAGDAEKAAPAEENKPHRTRKESQKREHENRDYVKVGVSEDEMKYALEFVNTLIANMGLSATASAASAPEGEEFTATEEAPLYPAIEIVGDDKGILIGHHGETLDAIQFLVNLSAQRRTVGRGGHEGVKIKIDVENYRAKREEALRILARKMAGRAVKYRKNVFLEPMNPYERRIIHSELQSYPGVSTHSVGSDKDRKIVISYEGEGKQK